jgi:hypothetical protein
MWKFKESALGNTREENINEFATRLKALVGVIDEIVSLRAEKNILPGETASDLVLLSEFNSMEDLEKYNKHPEHQKVLAFGKEVIAERRAVDFEM